eukprot:jgi/Orpsp1_1/1175746/evm.model.c7180000055058.1
MSDMYNSDNNYENNINFNTNINNYENDNNENVTEKYTSEIFENIIRFIWIILCIYMIGNLIVFIQYSKRPQFQYRGIAVTLLYGISGAAYVILILLNCYKLSNTKVNTITLNGSSYEPEKIAKRMIILPIIIDIIVTGITSYLVKDNCSNSPFSFGPIIIFSVLFTFAYPYLIYQLHKVHEFHRITTEKEYIVTMILWIILFSLYAIVSFVPKYKNNEKIQYYTNEGVYFFVLQELLGFIIIMNVPFIEMMYDKKKFEDFNEEMSIEYFYKLINDPTVVEELKEVAISEFSVENVLFWESYRELMKLTKYKKETAFKKIINGINNVHKSIKPNNNLFGKLISNEQKDEYSDNMINNDRKYYNILGNKNDNYEQKNIIREMEVYPNTFYGNDYNYGYYRNNSTNNLLEEFKKIENMKNSYTYTYGTPPSNNYTYVDDRFMDKYDQYNYNYYNQNQGSQRRRSINKQYKINISERPEMSDKSVDGSSASSDVTADTPVPLKYYNYYQNFYNTFINVNSTAVVNINCSVRQTIEDNMKNPKIGIFDE